MYFVTYAQAQHILFTSPAALSFALNTKATSISNHKYLDKTHMAITVSRTFIRDLDTLSVQLLLASHSTRHISQIVQSLPTGHSHKCLDSSHMTNNGKSNKKQIKQNNQVKWSHI